MNFTKEEYKTRLKKVQSLMQKKGIELLVSHDTANMNYLTGYDAWSFYYAQAVVVHVNDEEPICWVRKQDSGGAYIKTYLKNENIIEYDEKYIHRWPLHPYDNLVDIIKEKLLDINKLLKSEQTIVTNLRHFDSLSNAEGSLVEIEKGIQNGLSGDLLSIDLRSAIESIGAITGQITNDEMLGNIFSNFCIGK